MPWSPRRQPAAITVNRVGRSVSGLIWQMARRVKFDSCAVSSRLCWPGASRPKQCSPLLCNHVGTVWNQAVFKPFPRRPRHCSRSRRGRVLACHACGGRGLCGRCDVRSGVSRFSWKSWRMWWSCLHRSSLESSGRVSLWQSRADRLLGLRKGSRRHADEPSRRGLGRAANYEGASNR